MSATQHSCLDTVGRNIRNTAKNLPVCLGPRRWCFWTSASEMYITIRYDTICECIIVVHSTTLNSSDNLPSYPPDNHHSSDDVYWRGGGLTCSNSGKGGWKKTKITVVVSNIIHALTCLYCGGFLSSCTTSLQFVRYVLCRQDTVASVTAATI